MKYGGLHPENQFKSYKFISAILLLFLAVTFVLQSVHLRTYDFPDLGSFVYDIIGYCAVYQVFPLNEKKIIIPIFYLQTILIYCFTF